MLNLSFHGDAEECDEVHDEDGPEDWYVEKLEEGAEEGDEGGFGGGIPEFELWQASDERPELVRLPRWQRHAVCVGATFSLGLSSLELCVSWVDLGRQEGQQQVQVVNGQCIGHYVPALFEYDANQECSNNSDGKNPTRNCMRCPPI